MAPRSAAAKLAKRNKIKKTANPPKRSDAPQRPGGTEVSAKIPLELQQLLLNVFRNAFPSRFGSDLKPLLQEVKQHLYNRDFLTAFGKAEYLEAYAVRWSPSRALGYLQIFNDLEQHFPAIEEPGSRDPGSPWRVVCLGGGAGAEIVGLAGLLRQLTRKETPSKSTQDTAMSAPTQPLFEISVIDIANWTPVVTSLQSAITTAPTLSQYASTAAKESNTELLSPHLFKTTSLQQDVLTMPAEDLSAQLHNADLITLMFTLNELYSSSLAKTQAFLMRLTSILQQGSLLLIVDSPGSYSTVTLNGAEKQYPMHWLLDHTLLSVPKDARSNKEAPKWEKVHSDESRWFRLPDGVKYPIDLENMRYQIHLYRRLP